MKEYVAISDDLDRLTGKAERYSAAKRHIWRRISHVILKTKDDKIVLQQRSKIVTRPLGYDSSAAGCVRYGDTYLSAAKKELYEEIGVKTKLKKVAKFIDKKRRLHTVLYMGYYDGKFIKNMEVRKIVIISLKEAIAMMKKDPSKLGPGLTYVLGHYAQEIKEF